MCFFVSPSSSDIWSLGVILFMLVCGQPPFQEANDSETLTMIMDCKYTVPAHVSSACKEWVVHHNIHNIHTRITEFLCLIFLMDFLRNKSDKA